ncbi:MAG: amino acid ABC transporter [Phototrophicales bacterium]|nr:MAG: amino acid ABC transporter [Phototrophicales bacterium]
MGAIADTFVGTSVRLGLGRLREFKNSREFSLKTLPWWFIALIGLFVVAAILIFSNDVFEGIFRQLLAGVKTTLFVSAVAYTTAAVIGLVLGLIRVNEPKPNSSVFKTIIYNVATFYVEVLRGLPILVVVLAVAFVIIPQIITFMSEDLGLAVTVRDVPGRWRAIIALSLTYSAFLSEVFRSGIQSIGRGQTDAARSLGMTYVQVMRFVVLPQALRRVLPPLGNDVIAMIKDSSLVSIIGVRDITQIAKTSSGRSFLLMETYFIAALLYLLVTVMGSLLVRYIEQRYDFDE